MVITDKQQVFIIKEIKRLAKAIRDDDAPEGAAEITSILIDMLGSILIGQLTVEDFHNILESAPELKQVETFYKLYFTAIETL